MDKIGRNDLCPCGSGKKYKKCCIDKEKLFHDKPEAKIIVDDFRQYLDSFWTYEEADSMSTMEIIEKLEAAGIPFEEKAFLKDTETFYSAEALSENWFQRYRPAVKDRDEDFPYYAALILWERLAPGLNLSKEKMSNLIEEGFNLLENKDPVKACDIWLRVWDGIKYRWKSEYRSMDSLDDRYKRSFFVSNFCQDLEDELRNAGVKNSSYYEKRITYCREFCNRFPEEKELILHNMKRAIADSYCSLGDYKQADLECEKLVTEYPNNPWGYIEWGDQYFFNPRKDYAVARKYYEKARAIAQNNKDDDGLMAVEERLEDLPLL